MACRMRRWTGFSPSRASGSARCMMVDKRIGEVALFQRRLQIDVARPRPPDGGSTGFAHASSALVYVEIRVMLWHSANQPARTMQVRAHAAQTPGRQFAFRQWMNSRLRASPARPAVRAPAAPAIRAVRRGADAGKSRSGRSPSEYRRPRAAARPALRRGRPAAPAIGRDRAAAAGRLTALPDFGETWLRSSVEPVRRSAPDRARSRVPTAWRARSARPVRGPGVGSSRWAISTESPSQDRDADRAPAAGAAGRRPSPARRARRAPSISLAAWEVSSSTLYSPRCSSSRARQVSETLLPGCSAGLSLGRAPATDEAEMAAMVAGHHLQDRGAFAMSLEADDRALVRPFHEDRM